MRGMRVLGIDPGSQTMGWGVVAGEGPRYKVVEYGAIRLASGQKFSSRLLTVCSEIESIIARHDPDVCAIEDGFLATNVKVTLKLGQVRGVAMLAAERAGLEIQEYSPRLVKQTVVGYGAGDGARAALVGYPARTSGRGGRSGSCDLSFSSCGCDATDSCGRGTCQVVERGTPPFDALMRAP